MTAPNAEAAITEGLRLGLVVPVVGAGFAAATARLPGWPQLISSGFDYVDAKKTWDPAVVSQARESFQPSNPASLIAGARRVKELLGAPLGEFPGWLKHMLTVRRESCELRLLNAVADLNAPVVATTNYDKLLSMFHPNPTPVTWRDPAAMAGLFSGSEPKVFHVHGVYDRADTVVFGEDDYNSLVKDAAYRAVLQTLWLDRTLLFIGCSLDGLQDPDFIRFLEWTTVTFPGLTREHYALARRNEVSHELRRHLLHDCRVLVVEYGETYGDLPEWLARVNPNRAEAVELRRARALELIGEHDAVAFGATFSGLVVGGAPKPVATFADLAEPLFASHARTLMRERNELVALQRLTRQLISEESLREALEAYDSHAVSMKWDLFYNTALAAGEVLFVFQRRVLARLWRLHAGVHTYSATGELGTELSHARRLPEFARFDSYTQENLARILRSVVSVLDADAETLFPEPRPSRRMTADGDALVVVHGDGLELRALRDPSTIIGELVETPPDMMGAAAVNLRGRPVIVAYNPERITAWDPRLADAPIAEFRLDALPLDEQDLLGIYSVVHRETSSGLLSSVVIGSNVHWLRDLEWTGSTETNDKALSEQLWLRDDAVFAVSGHSDRVVRIDRDGVHRVLHGGQLLEMLRTLPNPLPEDVALDNFRLRSVTHDGRAVLGVRARVRNGVFGSAFALLDVNDDQPTLIGAWITPNRVAVDVASFVDADGSTLLFSSALFDYSNRAPEPLVHRARGVQTTRGLIFVEDGNAVPATEDMFEILPVSAAAGFAADTRGNIFAFDVTANSSQRVGQVERPKALLQFPHRR